MHGFQSLDGHSILHDLTVEQKLYAAIHAIVNVLEKKEITTFTEIDEEATRVVQEFKRFCNGEVPAENVGASFTGEVPVEESNGVSDSA